MSPDVALALAALFTGLGGVLTAYATVVRARHEGSEQAEAECVERLHAARTEAEQANAALHAYRMEHP